MSKRDASAGLGSDDGWPAWACHKVGLGTLTAVGNDRFRGSELH